MYWNEHEPPHFHAEYGGCEAVVNINSLRLTEGRLPPRAERMVVEWANQHRSELQDAWQRAQQRQHPGKIAPLE